MRVAVGGIVHDRWTYQPWLHGLEALDRKGVDAQWTFVVDSVDGEAARLTGDATARMELPLPRYNRSPNLECEDKRRTYARLACLRNILREMVLATDCDALFSVDSDIIPPPDTLQRLLDTGRPWVAALVRNSQHEKRAWNVFRISRFDQRGGLIKRFQPVGTGPRGEQWPGPEGAGWDPREKERTQDLAAGAVCLYQRELLERARWSTNQSGRQEDLGFAEGAFAAGFRAWYLPIVCRHLTVDGVSDAE